MKRADQSCLGKPDYTGSDLFIFPAMLVGLMMVVLSGASSARGFQYEVTRDPLSLGSELTRDGLVFTRGGSAQVGVASRITGESIFRVCCFKSSLDYRAHILGTAEKFRLLVFRSVPEDNATKLSVYGAERQLVFENLIEEPLTELVFQRDERTERLHFWTSRKAWTFSISSHLSSVQAPWVESVPNAAVFDENGGVFSYADDSGGILIKGLGVHAGFRRVCGDLSGDTRYYAAARNPREVLVAADYDGDVCIVRQDVALPRGALKFRKRGEIKRMLFSDEKLFVLTTNEFSAYSLSSLEKLAEVHIDDAIRDYGVRPGPMYGFSSATRGRGGNMTYLRGNPSTGLFVTVRYEE